MATKAKKQKEVKFNGVTFAALESAGVLPEVIETGKKGSLFRLPEEISAAPADTPFDVTYEGLIFKSKKGTGLPNYKTVEAIKANEQQILNGTHFAAHRFIYNGVPFLNMPENSEALTSANAVLIKTYKGDQNASTNSDRYDRFAVA
jgi:hypothetical protein